MAKAKKKKSAVSIKISKLEQEGKPHKQAVAIALAMSTAHMLGPKGGYRRARGARSSGRGRTKRKPPFLQ